MGTGKDYLMDHVVKPFIEKQGLRYRYIYFADHLKVSAAAENDMNIHCMYGQKNSRNQKNVAKKRD